MCDLMYAAARMGTGDSRMRPSAVQRGKSAGSEAFARGDDPARRVDHRAGVAPQRAGRNPMKLSGLGHRFSCRRDGCRCPGELAAARRGLHFGRA
jgi:hypothetical protein